MAFIVGTVASYRINFPWWILVAAALGIAFTTLLGLALILTLWRYLVAQKTKVNPGGLPALRYNGVVNGKEGGFHLPGLGGDTWWFQVMRITNTQRAIPVPANNVRATIRYEHADREELIVHEALWIVNTGLAKFSSRIHIESNSTELLCIAGSQLQGGSFFVVEDVASRSKIKLLRPGQWNVEVSIEMDNGNGKPYQGVGAFLITKDNRFEWDGVHAFLFPD